MLPEERTPPAAIDEEALAAAIAGRVPGADQRRVRSLLKAWWRYAGIRAAAGAVVDSDRFIAERSALGLLELPPASARVVIELEFALLHDPVARDRALAGVPTPAEESSAPPLHAVEPPPVVEPVVEPEPVAALAPEPVAEPVVVFAPEPVAEPEPVVAFVPEPAAEPDPVVAFLPEAVAASAPDPVAEPEPVVSLAAEPVAEPEPMLAFASDTAVMEPEPVAALAPLATADASSVIEDDEPVPIAVLAAQHGVDIEPKRSTPEELRTFALAGLVVVVSLSIGIAIVASRAMPSLGGAQALVDPWRAWLAVLVGAAGAIAAVVAATRSARLRRGVLAPGAGLAGIAALGVGLLAGMAAVALGGGAVAALGAVGAVAVGRHGR